LKIFSKNVKHYRSSSGQNLMKTTEISKINWRINMHDIAPMFVALGLFVMIGYIVFQTQQHRLRMKMVESGVTNLDLTKMRAPSDNSLKYGLVAIALGVAIFMGLVFERYVPDLGGEFTLAFVPIFVGVALLVSAFIERQRERNKPAV
jgi:hypothetical protein